ncbi:MAG: hypothetical protein GX117_12925 [Candidatus Hydrogenedentes bacterium]|nr:hypothetical protein [Candidatus Hydrogenedentota bacterium]
MRYFKTIQFIPGKGDAYTYYECDDNNALLRQMTYIPETEEIQRIPDPIVKELYQSDRLQTATAAEFESLWNEEA